MLFIQRKEQEAFTISSEYGDVITIKVTNIYSNLVTIGIDAPHDFSIERDDSKKTKRKLKHD